MSAPAGSDRHHPPPGRHRGSEVTVWLGMVLVVALAFAVGLVTG